MTDFTVLGAGAMGTAISFLVTSNGYKVLMWARRKEIADGINKNRVNAEYMPYISLPEGVEATTDLKRCIESSNKIVFAIPSHGIRDVCLEINKYKPSQKIWLSVIKGIDPPLKNTISQLLQELLQIDKNEIAVLSGPIFAIEIVENIPTIGVIGCVSKSLASTFTKALTTEYFLIENTSDVKGVEIGGVLKNIGAIAIGLIDGLNLGDNTRGLVFSKYMQEALKVGVKIFKAKTETLLSPACLGDMITTAFSYKSRNRIIGLLASKCITNVPKHTFIAEGKSSVGIIRKLAKEKGINIPVTEFVEAVLTGTKPIIAFNNLWKNFRKDSQSHAPFL